MRLVRAASHTTPWNVASTRPRHAAVLCVCFPLAFLFLPFHTAYAQQIRYGYDDVGRLQWVQDQTGDVAIYIYDPVGNILQIIRGNFPDPNAPVGISAFYPAKGGVGTAVTIFGRGFDRSPLQNTVTFSGTPATVTAASPTQLTVTVPSGAATGPIAVTAPPGTGTSAQAFTVLVAPTVSPSAAALFPKQTQVFTATQPAQWRANNVVGGNATVGTITQTGTTATYTAPAAVPPTGVVTITAANQDAFTLQDSATVEILPSTDPLRAPLVSIARPSAAPPGLLPAPLVSVTRAPAPASAGLLTMPVLSVTRAPAQVTAAPAVGPLVSAAREPVVTAVQDPATGLSAKFLRGTANQNVRLLGAGFSGATAVVFNLATSPDPNIAVNSFTVDSATQITADITIASGAAVGLRVARVTAGGVTSTAQGIGGNLLEVLP